MEGLDLRARRHIRFRRICAETDLLPSAVTAPRVYLIKNHGPDETLRLKHIKNPTATRITPNRVLKRTLPLLALDN